MRQTFFLLIGGFLLLLISFLFGNKVFSANAHEPSSTAKKIISSCSNVKDKDACITDEFQSITKQNTLSYALEVVKALQKDENLPSGCHFIAHVIAAEEIKKDPQAWEDIVSRLPIEDCTGGYLMGAIEGRQLYDKNLTLNEKTILDFCKQVKVKTNGNDQTCVHTMGHILLVEKMGNIDNTLQICTNLPDKYHYECMSGVFMENLYGRNLEAHGVSNPRAWNNQTQDEQKQLCSSYTDIAGQACWREFSHMIVAMNKSNPEKVYKDCLEAPTETMQTACYDHAISVMALTKQFTTLDFLALCKPYTSTQNYNACIRNIIDTMLASSSTFKDRVMKFCNAVDQSSQKSCFKYAERSI